MREFIFTERERKTIEAFLQGEISRDSRLLKHISTRIGDFDDLYSDVVIYLNLRRRFTQPSAK